MISTVTTVVSSTIASGLYQAVFEGVVVLSLLCALIAVEITVSMQRVALRRFARSAAIVTVPMLIAFVVILGVRVATALVG